MRGKSEWARRKTGGWLYNVLEYIEEPAVRQLGSDGEPDNITPAQLEGIAQLCQLPLPWLNCPSRRNAIVYPMDSSTTYRNAKNVLASPRLDYVANYGDTYPVYDADGPVTLAQGVQGFGFNPEIDRRYVTGIAFPRSKIAPKDVIDGLSHTYLVGEKALNTDHYSVNAYNVQKGHLPFRSGWLATAYWPPLRDPIGTEPHVT